VPRRSRSREGHEATNLTLGHSARRSAPHLPLLKLGGRYQGSTFRAGTYRHGAEQLEAADPKRQPVIAAASQPQPQPRSPRILRQRSRRGAPSALRSRQGTRRCAWKTRPCDEGRTQALGFRLYGPLCAALFSLASASGRCRRSPTRRTTSWRQRLASRAAARRKACLRLSGTHRFTCRLTPTRRRVQRAEA
jgi:hypothetical protein